ncbi:nucleotide-diphospho-sugar transferase [Auriscalpium vulgare]|uniref:Nucleotide-diphospho-sugar transferase n=1 Tax=Auriscalpium vulgare TaxID=40419 RepID=A0ACB8R968_9AGAM|nr:nucleotide-diphospho-sugar transferase [Auriscalpium vulgare]
MAPKAAAGKEKLVDDDEEVLQAVILADSFNKRFKPLTADKPRCLLPICNAPLLDWTLESLALAGVQEVFVICRSHADQIKAALQNSKWSRPASGLKIVPILTARETLSPGDAMRDIYTHGIIAGDFVLVYGDLVSNVRIDEVVRVHKARRRTNKDAIMTIVVKEAGTTHRTRSRGESAVFVLDRDTAECLHYEPVSGYPPKTLARIPREVLDEHPDIEIRNDLIDCGIDVCSVEVPSLFQDNFDYADIRRDFVHGVLTSDLLMKNIHCYVAREGYAARVQDTRSYDAISKDILSRWTFPLVPDDNHPGDVAYEHLRGNKYLPKDNSVVLSRTCKVGRNTLIGPASQIFADAQVAASTLGARCTVGARAVVRDSYLGDDVVVGAGCVIENSIVGAGVHVGAGTRIARGALVADGVRLGAGSRLLPFERVSRRRPVKEDGEEDGAEEEESDDDSEIEEAEENQTQLSSLLGPDSDAFVWPRKSGKGGNEDEDELENFNNARLMRLGKFRDDFADLDLSDPGSVTSSSGDSDESSDDDSVIQNFSPSSSTTSLPFAAAAISAGEHAKESEFRSEVRQSLERAFAEGHALDNAAVELKTLRMASNVPLARVREAVVERVVESIALVDGAGPQRVEIKRWVDRWGPLVRLIGGVDGVETVSILQAHCAGSSRLPLFGQILAAFYQNDIVEEDDIRAWHAQPAAKGAGLKEGPQLENMQKTWLVGARMIHQFNEQESSEEESSEAEESGEGSEEAEDASEDEDEDKEDEEDEEDEDDEDDEDGDKE